MKTIEKKIEFKLQLNEFDKIFCTKEKLETLEKAPIFYLIFDFEKNTMQINNKKFKVVKDTRNEYTWKIQKTQIKAIDGILGLQECLFKANLPNAIWNNDCYEFLCNVYKKVKTVNDK